MKLNTLRALVLACVVAVGVAVPAAAQQPLKADAAFSWALLVAQAELYTDDYTAIPVGWLGAVSVSLTKNLAVVGEFGGNYKSMTVTEYGYDIDVDVSEHAFLGGVKIQGDSPKTRPFFQTLFGMSRYSGGSSVGDYDVSVSSTGFAIQPGGGVDVFFSKRIGLRIQGDYRFVSGDEGSSNEFRVAVGVVIGFGG
jgi:hypothetical protein